MEKIYKCEDAALRYGVKIQTIWEWIRKKKLIAIDIGKEYRIPESSFAEFEKRRTAR